VLETFCAFRCNNSISNDNDDDDDDDDDDDNNNNNNRNSIHEECERKIDTSNEGQLEPTENHSDST
jgi:hypothetical protein